MATRLNSIVLQHFNKVSPNAPLAGGRMFFFEATPGSTTLKSTFTTSAGDIANSNPVILSAEGFEPNIFGEGSYRVELRSSIADGDLLQWNINPVDFSQVGGAFDDWLSTVDYGVSGVNIVFGSDGLYYISIQSPNINNDPVVSPEFWTQFDLLKRYNTNEAYLIGDPVTFNNKFYTSLTGSNLGNQPDVSPSDWQITSQTFSGALVGALTVESQTITSSWAFLDLWSKADYDTDGFWDVGDPDHFTIPAGVSRVRVSANIVFSKETFTAGDIIINFTNGILPGQSIPDGATKLFSNPLLFQSISPFFYSALLTTPIISVSEGDKISISAILSGATGAPDAKSQGSGGDFSWFQIEKIE